MIAKNRICCNYTKKNFAKIKKAKHKFCANCGANLNEFELSKDIVWFNKLKFRVESSRSGFSWKSPKYKKEYCLNPISYGGVSCYVEPKFLRRVLNARV